MRSTTFTLVAAGTLAGRMKNRYNEHSVSQQTPDHLPLDQVVGTLTKMIIVIF